MMIVSDFLGIIMNYDSSVTSDWPPVPPQHFGFRLGCYLILSLGSAPHQCRDFAPALELCGTLVANNVYRSHPITGTKDERIQPSMMP